MRRATRWLALTLCAASLLPAGLRAAPRQQVNAIGLIDYSRKPDFKVGDWVRYQISTRSPSGETDEYRVTLIIAGEENFWGEDGFWLETWTESKSRPPSGTATLMSYDIFRDSLPQSRMLLYQRKQINENDERGNPVQVVLRRSPSSLKLRRPIDDTIHMDIDTLGTDTTSLETTQFQVLKVRTATGQSSTRDVGDSTEYSEMWERRLDFLSHKIPITSIVRESIESTYTQRKWQVGRSADAPPMRIVDQSIGEARLMDYGTGLKAKVVPEYLQKSLPNRAAAPASKPKTAGTGKKSG